MAKKQVNMNQAFKDLEEIVNQFEEGEIDLEESLDKFKQGLELAKFLKKRLSKLENEIEEIKEKYDNLEEVEDEQAENTELPF